MARPYLERDGFYMLVVGIRQLRVAERNQSPSVECLVTDELTEEQICEYRLEEAYRDKLMSPMAMARAVVSHREEFHVSQNELARRIGITAGTLHHYESLVNDLAPELQKELDAGNLTFKEARAICDLSGFERQIEIAEPFISGQLTSVYVEGVVQYAKENPEMPITEVIKGVFNALSREDKPRMAKNLDRKKGEQIRAIEMSVDDLSRLEAKILDFAGKLDALARETVPEYSRLSLVSSLGILQVKTEAARAALMRGGNGINSVGILRRSSAVAG